MLRTQVCDKSQSSSQADGPSSKSYCQLQNMAHIPDSNLIVGSKFRKPGPGTPLSKRASQPTQVTAFTEQWGDSVRGKQPWEDRMSLLESIMCNLQAERHQMRKDIEELCVAVQSITNLQIKRLADNESTFKAEFDAYKHQLSSAIVQLMADTREGKQPAFSLSITPSQTAQSAPDTSQRSGCCSNCPLVDAMNSELQSVRQILRGLDSEVQSSRKSFTCQIENLTERLERLDTRPSQRNPLLNSVSFCSVPEHLRKLDPPNSHRQNASSELCRLSVDTKEASDSSVGHQQKRTDSTRRQGKVKKINKLSVDLKRFEKSVEDIVYYSGQKAHQATSRLNTHKIKRSSTESAGQPLIWVPTNLMPKQPTASQSPGKNTSGPVVPKPPTNMSISHRFEKHPLRHSFSHATSETEPVTLKLGQDLHLMKSTGDQLVDEYGQKLKLLTKSELKTAKPPRKTVKK